MGSFRDLLVELAKNPAMIFWLDNNGNHMGAINENWGRELLELFSMGVGNYSEDDIKEASRAFTGWTIGPKIPRNPLGRFYWNFEYRPEDHDDGEKTFLGHTGNFDGQDIIRHRGAAAGHRALPVAPPVQLLRGRRAAGAQLEHHAAQRPGGH